MTELYCYILLTKHLNQVLIQSPWEKMVQNKDLSSLSMSYTNDITDTNEKGRMYLNKI